MAVAMGSTVGGSGGLDSGRRKFLLLAGAVLGAGAGTAIGLSIPRSARPHSTLKPAGGTVAPTPSASVAAGRPPQLSSPMAANWAALGRELSSGRLIRPGSAGYGRARLLFDPRFDDARPAGVAYCAVPADVSACLAFARRFGVPVAARSGGHSYGGWSTTSGLVIDVTPTAGVRVDGATGTARVGAGTRLIDLYSELAAH